MEFVGPEVALSEWRVSGEWMWRPRSLLHATVGFIDTVHLGYTKFIKQPESKSSARENDAVKRHG